MSRFEQTLRSDKVTSKIIVRIYFAIHYIFWDTFVVVVSFQGTQKFVWFKLISLFIDGEHLRFHSALV